MIDELTKQRAKDYPIIDLAIYLGLDVKGNVCRCFNPNHEDKNPSLGFKNNKFQCFKPTCGIHGDTIELVMQINNITFTEAVEYILSEKTGQPFSYTSSKASSPSKSSSSESGAKYSDIYEQFISLLSFPNSEHHLFADRKISLEVLKKNNIKNIPKLINPDDPQEKYYYCNKLRELFPEDRIKKSGLFRTILSCCAVIPFYHNGRIVYLQGITRPELLIKDNLSEKKTPPKVCNLTGISKADLYIPKLSEEGSIHLCEGVITALYFNRHGLDSIALLSGGSNLKEAIELLKPYKDREFILCPDEDSSGIAVIKSLKLELFKHGFKYNTKYFSSTDYGRKLGLNEEELSEIKDFNDLKHYL